MKPIMLIVDDDPDSVEACRRYLSGEGFDVLSAANGKEALDVLSTRRADVVLLNVKLPDASGFDLAGQIYEVSDAQIVFITARYALEDRVHALRMGSEYVIRPFMPEELLLRLARMEQRRDREAGAASAGGCSRNAKETRTGVNLQNRETT